MVTAIVGTIVGLWNAIPLMVEALISSIWGAFIDAVQWLLTLLRTLGLDIIGPGWSFDLSAAQPYVDAITYFFPVYQTLVIVAFTYGVVITIRATRWLLACIPTLSLG